MGNLNTLTNSSLRLYNDTLKKYGYVKQQEVEKLLILTFLFDIVNNSDYLYTFNNDTEVFEIDQELLTTTNYNFKRISMCLNNTSCIIQDTIIDNLEVPNPEVPEPPGNNPIVEYTFDGGISWYRAPEIGVRSYEVVFDEIPTIDMCGWRFAPEYTLFDFKIYSNSSWVTENYVDENDTSDRWNVFLGQLEDYKYFYWHEINSQGRPGRIYSQVRYRFKLINNADIS